MRRLGLGLLLSICALAGALAAVLLAGDVAAAVGTTGTDTTSSTTIATTTTAPTTTVPSVLADGVTVGGVDVSGLSAEAAFAIVRTAFEAPLVITVAGRTLQPEPAEIGAIAYVQNAVARARTAAPGTPVPLTVRVDGKKVRSYVAKVAARFDRAPQDSRLVAAPPRPVHLEGRARAIARPDRRDRLDRRIAARQPAGAARAALPADVRPR